MSKFSLKGQRALVTGANTGIGQAIALDLAAHGADVICAGRRSCDETLEKIKVDGGAASGLQLDFADPMAATSIFADQNISLLVNNAGIIRREDAVNFSVKDWDDVLDVNLKALFFTTQAFAKERMRQGKGGAVVNIASLLSFQGGIRVPSYTASKHAVAGVTKALANEWAPHNINVNAIAPGYIATENTKALREDPARNKAILERIPAGRWGDAEDVSGTCVFLCSAVAKYVHGAIINVDGGWMAR